MSKNKLQLAKDTRNAKNKFIKPDAFKNDIIVDPMGQWAHPGEITRIPSNNITMQGVPYPVLGIDDQGNQQMMLPGQDYIFPGNYVTEFPYFQTAGEKNQSNQDIGVRYGTKAQQLNNDAAKRREQHIKNHNMSPIPNTFENKNAGMYLTPIQRFQNNNSNGFIGGIGGYYNNWNIGLQGSHLNDQPYPGFDITTNSIMPSIGYNGKNNSFRGSIGIDHVNVNTPFENFHKNNLGNIQLGYRHNFKTGGMYKDMELTPEEIKRYKDLGYHIEELD